LVKVVEPPDLWGDCTRNFGFLKMKLLKGADISYF